MGMRSKSYADERFDLGGEVDEKGEVEEKRKEEKRLRTWKSKKTDLRPADVCE